MIPEVKRNEVINKLPKHLLQYVRDQHYERYSPIDQAVWRYVMHKNISYLPKVAHPSYLKGLSITGISSEWIPSMYGMNRILKKIGWAAVTVDGYIPTAAFMEFQAYNVLVIAQDIRRIEHIEYTPAPDILHEAAGHAPILANPEYAEYLRRLGQIGCRAISSNIEIELYQAVRHLAMIKESPQSTKKQIATAQEKVNQVQSHMGKASEMSQIKNLHWWTVEYGLIGNLKNPKIYGAGLLSSIGESKSCLKKTVKKYPYDLNAADQNFDITKPQPQLFVTPDFAHLSYVLEEYADRMALRTGGAAGIRKLIGSNQLGTIEYNTGIQVSGLFKHIWVDEYHNPIYFQTKGPTALAFQQKELIAHSTAHHPHGFGSPIGKLKNINIPIEKMSPYDLHAYKIREGNFTRLQFEGGITVEGNLITGKRTLNGNIILISFKNCTVAHRGNILFSPKDGVYHMAVGMKISSAFAGPADDDSFDLIDHTLSETHPVPSTPERDALMELYQEVRDMRKNKKINPKRIHQIRKMIIKDHPKDWLLKKELQELLIYSRTAHSS